MSDTNAKQRDGSPDTVEANATQVDDDDVDLDLDAALFGDDDEDNAEPSADGPAPSAEQEEETSAGRQVEQPSTEQPLEADRAREELAERNKLMMDLMTEQQLDRVEAMRRSNLSGRNMKRVLQTITGQNVSANVLLVMRGMAKVYVGELVEAAAVIAAEQGDSGPLQPSHYATAYQQLDQQGKVPRKTPSKKLKL